MKKQFWVIGLLLAIIIPIGTVWGLRQYQLKQFNTLHHTRNLTIIEDVPSISAIGTHHTGQFENQVIFFSQSDESSAISQEIKNHLDSLTPRHVGLLSQEWLVIFPRTKKEPLLKGVTTYDLVQETYQAKGIETKLAHEEIISTFYADADGKPITLENLIADKESFRKILDTVLYDSEEPQAKQARLDLLALFDQEDWSSIDFTIEKDTLLVDKASISLSIFLDSLNRDYFTEQALNDFQEIEQARQLMETSEEAVVIHYN